MKFLEYTPLARINAFLSHVDVGGCMIQGGLEAYSCKLAGVDKKLSRSLEQEVVDSLAYLPFDLSTSPVGSLSSTARTLIYLILTLNHMYPDYDFSMLRPQHFIKEHGVFAAKQKIDVSLVEASKIWFTEVGEETTLMDSIWNAIDEVMTLEDCEVYSYSPDAEGDPFADTGSIWSFNYFFYNKKQKRILYFSSRCASKLSMDMTSSDDGSAEWDFDFVDGMDLEG
uniref:Repressor of RNA polymerase III transcription n=1 Tax=Physcomitrium patens TaxID=3218 RepID=A0A7I4E8B6_PHYPA